MKNWYKILSFFRTLFGLYQGKGRRLFKTGGDLDLWRMTFHDDFSKDKLDKTKWNTRFSFGRTDVHQNLQWYYDSQISIKDGICHLVASRNYEMKDQRKFRSAMLSTGPENKWDGPKTFEQLYGYFEIRCKVPKGAGFWPAFWLYNGLPEIDIMEMGGSKTKYLRSAYHYGDSYSAKDITSQGIKVRIPDASKNYHTYGVDWEPNKLTYYFDGYPIWVVKSDFVCDKPRFIIINLAISYPGVFGETVNKNTVFPSSFDLDYVKVFKRT